MNPKRIYFCCCDCNCRKENDREKEQCDDCDNGIHFVRRENGHDIYLNYETEEFLR